MRKLIGDKAFYKKVLMLTIPIMVQNGITNFVGFLDNIMVGRLGTEQMSGVAIMNQLFFVFALCTFGGLSGAGIFGAQFFGKGDHEGVRNTFRFKLITGIVIAALTIMIFLFFGENLLRLYLTTDGTTNAQATFEYGKEYMLVALFEIVPFLMVQIYASTLRETGQTLVPMIAGVVAVVVNLVFNYILIFGKFGAPKLGVMGAALATDLARMVEMTIVVVWTHRNKVKNAFIVGAYRTLRVPKELVGRIMRKGSPLLVNELLWSAGVATVIQCFSVRGLDVVAGVNIASTIANLFNIIFIAMGNSVAIMVGQQLGANDFPKAKDTAYKLITFSVLSTLVTGDLMFALSGLFPQLYNTTGEIKTMAMRMIQITAVLMPMQAFLHATYFTVRSGGRTVITFLFDSGYTWVIAVPFAYCIVHFTGLPILVVYAMYYCLDFIKSAVGWILLKKGVWMRNIVDEM